MKKHTKIYMKFFGYGLDSYVPCEICGNRCQDVHHIDCRGMGGSKTKDDISNLMGLCREHHIEYGDKKHYIDFLKTIHQKKMDEVLRQF